MSLSLTDASPIASEIGHGAPGLRDCLRSFEELVSESACQKHVYVACRPRRLLTSWTADSTAGVWTTDVTEAWAGYLRDVVRVVTASEVLVRAETIALCRSTAGTYYYDVGTATTLYVHLTAGASPVATTVIAELHFGYGSHAVTQPTLGVELLADGGLETWTTVTDLASWAEAGIASGAGSVTQAAGVDDVGTYAAECTVNAGTNGSGYGISPASKDEGVATRMYRACGWYSTPEDMPGGIEARIRLGYANNYLLSDGRGTTTATTGFALTPTRGCRRRFVFDFLCPGDTAVLDFAAFAYSADGSAGSVTFDGLSLKRIWRFEMWEARLSLESVPEIDERRQGADAYFSPIARGAGTLSFVNGDGHFEPVLSSLDWINSELWIYSGGRYPDGGNEITLDDFFPKVLGVVTPRIRLTDRTLLLSFEDILSRLQIQLPPRTQDAALYDEDKGRRRPMGFGYSPSTFGILHVAPIAIGIDAATAPYGLFEIMDMTEAPAAYTAAGVSMYIYSYLDREAADKRDADRRVRLYGPVGGASPGPTFGWDVSGLTVSMVKNPRAVEITAENCVFEFDIGGATITADMAASIGARIFGLGAANPDTADDHGLLDELCLYLWVRAGGGSWSATVDATTHLVTISKLDGGTFNIRCQSGPNAARGIYGILGFAATADLTGALSYTGTVPTFINPRGLNLRVDFDGYPDDASGTYTGTANQGICLAPDVLHALLVRWGHEDPARIDVASFVAARTSCGARWPSVYLGVVGEGALELRTVIQRLENGSGHELTFHRGQWHFDQRNGSTPDDVIDLDEDDYLEIESGLDVADVYDTVRVAYAQDPVTGRWKTAERHSAATQLRYREEQRTFDTYLANADDAAGRRAELVREASTPKRRFVVSAKGSLYTSPIGQKVRLTRAKGLDRTGALENVLCRIVGKRDNVVSWDTVADLIEVPMDYARKVYSTTTAAATTGAAEETLHSYSVFGGTLGTDGEVLQVVTSGYFAANGNNKAVKFEWGATSVTVFNGAYNALRWEIEAKILRKGAASQLLSVVGHLGGEHVTLGGTGARPTPTETLADDVLWRIRAQGTAAADIVNEDSIIMLWPDAA